MSIAIKKYLILFASISILAALLTGCYKEDEADCAGSLEVAFRFMKGGDNLFEPEVKSISLFVFDENSVFLGRYDEYNVKVLTNNYKMKLNLRPGKYYFVAWGGLRDNQYQVYDTKGGGTKTLSPGSAAINNMSLQIKSEHANYIESFCYLVNYRPADLFYGNKFGFTVPENTVKSNEVVIDLKKYSTRINVEMSGLPMPASTNPNTYYYFHMQAPNGAYNFYDEFDDSGNDIIYLAQYDHTNPGNHILMDIHTLRLGYGRSNNFVIYDKENKGVFYEADLLEDYISKDPRYDTQEKVDAEDYFNISIQFDAGLDVQVWINGWKLGSSDQELQ